MSIEYTNGNIKMGGTNDAGILTRRTGEYELKGEKNSEQKTTNAES